MTTPPPTFPCKRCGEELWSLAQVDGLATCPKCRTVNVHAELAKDLKKKFVRRHRLLILSPLLILPTVAMLAPVAAKNGSMWEDPIKAIGILWCLWGPIVFAFVFGAIRYARRRRIWPTIVVATWWYVVSAIVVAAGFGVLIATGAGVAGGR